MKLPLNVYCLPIKLWLMSLKTHVKSIVYPRCNRSSFVLSLFCSIILAIKNVLILHDISYDFPVIDTLNISPCALPTLMLILNLHSALCACSRVRDWKIKKTNIWWNNTNLIKEFKHSYLHTRCLIFLRPMQIQSLHNFAILELT